LIRAVCSLAESDSKYSKLIVSTPSTWPREVLSDFLEDELPPEELPEPDPPEVPPVELPDPPVPPVLETFVPICFALLKASRASFKALTASAISLCVLE
jgi:hypothetical protein